ENTEGFMPKTKMSLYVIALVGILLCCICTCAVVCLIGGNNEHIIDNNRYLLQKTRMKSEGRGLCHRRRQQDNYNCVSSADFGEAAATYPRRFYA
ncbi:MAG: hypothetical protein VW337_06430, partial [Gammaproteobacteria bacterium]